MIESTELKILITGGTGFIGSELTNCLMNRGFHVTVLSRSPDLAKNRCGVGVNVISNFNEIKADDTFNIVINLAGAPIFGERWSDKRKIILQHLRLRIIQNSNAGLCI